MRRPFFDEHLMKKSDRPWQQISVLGTVEFWFAVEVTLSDSEISSPRHAAKSCSTHRTRFPHSPKKTQVWRIPDGVKRLKQKKIRSRNG
jgi:hypothetical protein